MMIKYRVHEVSKDFDVPSKDVLDLLKKYFPEPKKNMTALTEEELDVVFDSFTKQRAVESFDEYFAVGEKARAEREAERARKLEEQRQLAEQLAAAAREETARLAREAAAAKSPAQSADSHAAPGPNNNNNKPGKINQTDTRRPAASGAPAKSPAPAPFTPRPKQPGQAPNRGPAEIRRVDTRSAQVDLDKYNEKYEQIAPTRTVSDKTYQGKQKIKQRSHDYRKPQGTKRETEADKLRRLQLERIKKTPITVSIGDAITVGELASRLKKTASEVIKKLMGFDVMASVSDTIDFDTAEMVATELGAKVEREVVLTIEDRIIDDTADTEANLVPRSPVVVVMGHVDHGKTSLLDAIRHTNVTEGEAGGITQHIGAYRVTVGSAGKAREITFLDTPGHEAFTSMRRRGAEVTDIAVLVVAADDGIMPQTVEAINHAKAAKVSIIVAINKMDKTGADPQRIMQQLTEYDLVPEEWGGDVICVPVSAVTREGIGRLLESIVLVAEMKELKANPARRAKGAVIEARLDKGRGPVATVLVQNGTLHSGDVIVAGMAVGRVRAMVDDRGEKVEDAGPSVPVEITGLAEVPEAGDSFDAVSDERLARELVEQRKHERKEAEFGDRQQVTLENLFSQIQEGEMKELNIIVKADVQGSAEAVRQSLEKLGNDEIRVRVIHGGVGAISESDVMLASTSGAIIVGFNVRPDPVAQQNAQRDGVDLRLYRVIYDCIEEIESAMKGMLAPKFREVPLGRIEVRQVYKITGAGVIAGCYVLEGKVTRGAEIRVVRDGIVVTEAKIDSLRRFKDDVREVAQGYECGIGLEKYGDIKVGDIYEAFLIEEYRD